MPKKKHPESPEEQSARFKKDVEELINAGDLNPTEAANAVERLLRKEKHAPPVKG